MLVVVEVVRVERFRLDSNNFTRVYLLVGGKICRKRKKPVRIERLGREHKGCERPNNYTLLVAEEVVNV